MLKDSIDSPNSLLEFSIEKGKTVDSIISFLDEKLPAFATDLDGMAKNEDEISQECCIYLDREARETLFMFHFQHKYKGGRSSDFSVILAEKFSSKEPLFVIEAKRLPTPGAGRQQEYVHGNLGGIERFKRGYHGGGLSRSAMLGYIQKNSCDHWFSEINSWITNLANNGVDSTISWSGADEQLKFIKKLDWINKYCSSHLRIGQPDINLHHYLLPLPQRPKNVTSQVKIQFF